MKKYKDYDLSELMIYFNIISLYMQQVRYEFHPICKHWTARKRLGLGPSFISSPSTSERGSPQKWLNSKTYLTKKALLFLDRLEFYGPCTHEVYCSFTGKMHILSSPCLMMLILSTQTSTRSTDQRQDFNLPCIHKCSNITDWKRRFWKCCFKSI